MAKTLFGTDGIRGVAGEPPMDARTAYALGVALGRWAHEVRGEEAPTPRDSREVLIGMDTRESGPWLAEAVAAGLRAEGVGPRFAGIVTTPGVAYLTRTGPFVAGVMISASHNPYQDNGLKVIGHSGYKLPDKVELELEATIHAVLGRSGNGDSPRSGNGDSPRSSGIGDSPEKLVVDRSLDHHYAHFLAGSVPGRLEMKLVIDCGNGAAAEIAPAVFADCGTTVDWMGVSPNGRNINLNCGSLHLEGLRKRVLETGADLGVAFDGDADRALFVSASGRIVDGDAVLYLAGSALKAKGRLPGDLVVATVMSNLGLEKALESVGLQMVRTPVGDKYVLEEMLRRGAVLGGEQSGHVIFSQYATTGDGLLTAVRVLEIVRDSGKSLDELVAAVQTFPQKLVNVRIKHRRPLAELHAVQEEIAAAEREFGDRGRVVVRFSGTEPLARVMIEAGSMAEVDRWTTRIADAIRSELGAES